VNPTVSEIFNAAGLAWRDTRHVFDAIFNKVVIAFTITIIASALYMTLALMPRGGTSSFLLVMLVILTTAVQAFLITPYFIAVHRFIILGEVTTNYLLTPGEPRFLRFFGWLLVFFCVDIRRISAAAGIANIDGIPTRHPGRPLHRRHSRRAAGDHSPPRGGGRRAGRKLERGNGRHQRLYVAHIIHLPTCNATIGIRARYCGQNPGGLGRNSGDQRPDLQRRHAPDRLHVGHCNRLAAL
jgi:hypothetical protein